MRRKSEAEKTLAGTARADRRRRPVGGDGVPPMPRGLGQDKHAARAWRLVAQELAGVVAPVDGVALWLLVKHVSYAMQAAEQLEADGLMVDDRRHGGQMVKHPAMQTFLWNSDRAAALLKSFGATPAGRAALGGDFTGDDVPTLEEVLFGLGATMAHE